jgi:hypothetical protein
MPTSPLRSVPLLVALAALACSGKKEAPAAPVPAAPPAAAAPVAPPADPAAAFAKAMTEEKLQRLLAYEQESLPLTAELMAPMAKAALATGGDAKKMENQVSRDERLKQLSAQLEALQKKHGVTTQDQAGFVALTRHLLTKEIFATSARKALAEDEPRKAAWAKAEAEYNAKHKNDLRFVSYDVVAKRGTAPLGEFQEKMLQKQVADADAERKALVEKHGQAALDVLAKFIPQFVELREKQMDAVLKPK